MEKRIMNALPGFLEVLGLDEEPMGLSFTAEAPEDGLVPKPLELPTSEKEQQGDIDWQAVFADFSCAIGHIWRARRQKKAAWFSAEHFGCPGAAFWLGFMKPQTETIINYVSTGIPGWSDGELYCGSPDTLRKVFLEIDPPLAPKPYCVVKPLSLFEEQETPELVMFFARPEPLCGLHQLAFFVTDDPEVVASPWSAGCGSLVTWPRRYLAAGVMRAVVGGWDISARKFFRPDELSFTVPMAMFTAMLERWQESFLSRKEWGTVQKKLERSRKAWS